MSQEQANTWITKEFAQFYLNEQVSLIVNSLTTENFVSSLSDLVIANKDTAEAMIRANNTPEEAERLILILNSINYELLKSTYFYLYDQEVPHILPKNTQGIECMEWLQADVNNLKNYTPNIFAGGIDANKDSTRVDIQAALKALFEIQKDIDILKEQLRLLNYK